jgi:hypothetical protein
MSAISREEFQKQARFLLEQLAGAESSVIEEPDGEGPDKKGIVWGGDFPKSPPFFRTSGSPGEATPADQLRAVRMNVAAALAQIDAVLGQQKWEVCVGG